MRLVTLATRGFRNLGRQELELDRGANVFVGDNAQGKTNLLEAVSMLLRGRSPRLAQVHHLIARGEKEALVRGRVRSDSGLDHELELRLERGRGMRHRVDGAVLARLSELLSRVPSVTLLPGDDLLFEGAPVERRRYLDLLACQVFPGYLEVFRRHRRALATRNASLARGGTRELAAVTRAWLLEATQVTLLRERVGRFLAQVLEEQGEERLRLAYVCQDGRAAAAHPEAVEERLVAGLERTREQERRLCRTMVGPQRDDIAFTLDGHPLRGQSSRGEARRGIFVLKMAEAQLLATRRAETPVLLLDDPFAEVDSRVREELSSRMREDLQVLATATAVGLLGRLPVRGRTFELRDGKATSLHGLSERPGQAGLADLGAL